MELMLVEEEEEVVGEEVAGNILMYCICIFKECINCIRVDSDLIYLQLIIF